MTGTMPDTQIILESPSFIFHFFFEISAIIKNLIYERKAPCVTRNICQYFIWYDTLITP